MKNVHVWFVGANKISALAGGVYFNLATARAEKEELDSLFKHRAPHKIYSATISVNEDDLLEDF